MVREEQRRLDAINRPRLPAPVYQPQPFKDIRVTQRLRADELQSKGYLFHSKCESIDTFRSRLKRGEFPVGATHLWAIDEVWVPRDSAMPAPQRGEAA